MPGPLEDRPPPRQEADWTDAPPSPFRLHPLAEARRQGFLQLLVDKRRCIVPAMEGTPLMILPQAGVRFRGDEAEAEPVGITSRAASRLKAMAPLYGKAALRFGAVEVRPDGGREATRAYRKLVKFARTSGFAFDGETLRRHPELALGWPPSEQATQDEAGPAIAVALHLHYVELWPEVSGLLKRWRRRFSLLVSLTRADEAAAQSIRADFPSAEVEVVENKGRDVRPFLLWLENGRLDPFDLVCKIHGKRSLREGAPPLFGEMFRRATYLDLIGDGVEDICERFAAADDLGLVGPERFRARSRHGDPTEIMGQSRETIEALARRMNAPIKRDEDYDVFHGTMFWARPRALSRLRDLRLAESFEPEAGRSDGALEHAIEGLINHAVRAAGFQIAGTTAP
jgi:hypothetical protein